MDTWLGTSEYLLIENVLFLQAWHRHMFLYFFSWYSYILPFRWLFFRCDKHSQQDQATLLLSLIMGNWNCEFWPTWRIVDPWLRLLSLVEISILVQLWECTTTSRKQSMTVSSFNLNFTISCNLCLLLKREHTGDFITTNMRNVQREFESVRSMIWICTVERVQASKFATFCNSHPTSPDEKTLPARQSIEYQAVN